MSFKPALHEMYSKLVMAKFILVTMVAIRLLFTLVSFNSAIINIQLCTMMAIAQFNDNLTVMLTIMYMCVICWDAKLDVTQYIKHDFWLQI